MLTREQVECELRSGSKYDDPYPWQDVEPLLTDLLSALTTIASQRATIERLRGAIESTARTVRYSNPSVTTELLELLATEPTKGDACPLSPT